MMGEFNKIEANSSVRICPHSDCKKTAHQLRLSLPALVAPDGQTRIIMDISATRCAVCKKMAYWKDEELLYPQGKNPVPIANRDMPGNVQALYNEAANVSAISPRSAAALLRLAIAELCLELKAKGDTATDQIGDLILKGLPIQVLVALDDARMIGNNASQPGTIDLQDDQETAQTLFFNTNFIVEKMISQRRKAVDSYDYLAAEKIIENRATSES